MVPVIPSYLSKMSRLKPPTVATVDIDFKFDPGSSKISTGNPERWHLKKSITWMGLSPEFESKVATD